MFWNIGDDGNERLRKKREEEWQQILESRKIQALEKLVELNKKLLEVQNVSEKPTRPEKPTKEASLEDWFKYYDDCHSLGFKCTLKEIAKETGYSHQSIKNKRGPYLAEHKK